MNRIQRRVWIVSILQRKHLYKDIIKYILTYMECVSLKRCLFKIGRRLDVRDTVRNWVVAIVLNIRGNSVLIHYEQWGNKWDEWIEIDSNGYSPRIAPLHSFAAASTRCDLLNAPMNSPAHRYHAWKENASIDHRFIHRHNILRRCEEINTCILHWQCYCCTPESQLHAQLMEQNFGIHSTLHDFETSHIRNCEEIESVITEIESTTKIYHHTKSSKPVVRPRRGWSLKRIRKTQARMNRQYRCQFH